MNYDPRLIDAGALGSLDELARYGEPAALVSIRRQLRDESRWSDLSPAQRLWRASIRERVALRLINELGWPPESVASCLLPQVPDNAASLGELDGP